MAPPTKWTCQVKELVGRLSGLSVIEAAVSLLLCIPNPEIYGKETDLPMLASQHNDARWHLAEAQSKQEISCSNGNALWSGWDALQNE